eukprot:1463996-Rhodomonas_salina.1
MDEQDGDSEVSQVASQNQTKLESQGLSGADFVSPTKTVTASTVLPYSQWKPEVLWSRRGAV